MTLEDWIARIADRTARVGIIGLGYVGLPLALEFTRSGFPVLGLDIDAEKVARLTRGETYIVRIPADDIAEARANGFEATTDFARIHELDAILICVPTPLQDATHIPDMSYIEGTMASLSPHLRAGQLVVLESTTYPGTTAELVVPAIERHGHTVLRDETPANGATHPDLPGVLVAFSPEREDPGSTIVPRREIPKVIGGIDRRATAAACALYGTVFHQTVPVSSPAAAEMTKLLENIYRCVNIALVNEMKQLATHLNVDIWEVIDAARTKPFGFQAFYPGPGVGGHCIPVDPFYLSWKAAQLGVSARFIELAGQVNESMPRLVVKAIEDGLKRAPIAKTLAGATILILGVAYKRDVDDLRESPSLVVIEQLQQAGAVVEYNDPYFPYVGSGRHYRLDMRSTPLAEIPRFDCVVILTDHSGYDYKAIVDAAKLVVDSRNATRGIDSPNVIRC